MFIIVVEGKVPREDSFLVLNLELSLVVIVDPFAQPIVVSELHQDISTLSVNTLPPLHADWAIVLANWQSTVDTVRNEGLPHVQKIHCEVVKLALADGDHHW